MGTTKSDGSTASYYELPEGAKELQDLISHRDMNFYIGFIFCMCYDYCISGHSNIEIIKEIKENAEREIKRIENLQKVQN